MLTKDSMQASIRLPMKKRLPPWMSAGFGNRHNLTVIAKRTISGTISLKDGEKAPQEGIAVRITAIDGDEQTVVIPYGKSSVAYSLNVVPNAAGKGYKVRFETIKNYGYVRYGYYTKDGAVRSEANAEFVDVSRGTKTM